MTKPRLLERHWRTGAAGFTHAYLTTDPRALPSCSAPVRYGTTEPAVAGIRRCKHCERNYESARRTVEAQLAALDEADTARDAARQERFRAVQDAVLTKNRVGLGILLTPDREAIKREVAAVRERWSGR